MQSKVMWIKILAQRGLESPSPIPWALHLDADRNEFAVGIITTGTMINGIDAALHFVSFGSSRRELMGLLVLLPNLKNNKVI